MSSSVDRLALDQLADEIANDVAHHDVALHRILTKLRAYDASGGYERQGFRTCAQWLSWRVSWSLNTAREHVRVANALAELPLIDRALASGQLSYCKVRALTRVATPANEAGLLDMALLMTGDHLEKLCRKFAAVRNHDDPSGSSRPTKPVDDLQRRYVSRYDREDGMVVFEAVLHPDEADIVAAALERIARERCRASAEIPAEAHAATRPGDPRATLSTHPFAEIPAETRSAEIPAETQAATRPGDPRATLSTHPSTAAPRPADPRPRSAPSSHASVAIPAETSAPPQRTTNSRPRPAFDRATALVEMAQQVLRGTSPDRAPVDIMIAIPVETLLRTAPTAVSSSAPLATPSTAVSSSVPTPSTAVSSSAPPATPSTAVSSSVALATPSIAMSSSAPAATPSRAVPSPVPNEPIEASSVAALLRSPTTLISDLGMRSDRDTCCSDPLDVACGRDGTPLSAAAARRLACDAGVIAVIEDAHGNAISVGRKARTLSASLKRAMLRRDCKCRYPGCNARAFLEGHHLKHWADGGETVLSNVIALCSFHHRFVHEYGFRLELDVKTNIVSAYEPARERWIPGVPRRDEPIDPRWEEVFEDNSITTDTRPMWDATPVDYGAIVDLVLRAESRAGADADDRDPDDGAN